MSHSIRFDGRALALLCVVLLFSAFAGRQLYLDGANFVAQSLLDPFWYPHPTPRRAFSVLWGTLPVRAVGLIAPGAVAPAVLVYGLATYAVVAAAPLVIWRSALADRAKYLLLAFYFAATALLTNFVVTEFMQLIALSTIFVTYTIDPKGDPRAIRRFICAACLVATYELSIVTNVVLAVVSYVQSADEPRSRMNRLLLSGVLVTAVPYQLGWIAHNPYPTAEAASDRFVYLLAALGAGTLTAVGLVIRLVPHAWTRTAVPLAVLLGITALHFVPSALNFRSDLFAFSYPSRVFSMGLVLLIGVLPVLLNAKLWRLPTIVLDWYGDARLKTLSMAIFAGFLGVAILSSLDAIRFRAALTEALGDERGLMALEDCAFCRDPSAHGVPDLGYDWTWPAYSLLASLNARPDQTPAIVYVPGAFPAFTDDQYAALLAGAKRFGPEVADRSERSAAPAPSTP